MNRHKLIDQNGLIYYVSVDVAETKDLAKEKVKAAILGSHINPKFVMPEDYFEYIGIDYDILAAKLVPKDQYTCPDCGETVAASDRVRIQVCRCFYLCSPEDLQ